MAMPVVIAKNQTASDIDLERLGVRVPASGQIALAGTVDSPATYTECTEDETLEAGVTSGDIVINDGAADLSVAAGLSYLDSSGNLDGPVTGAAANALVKLSDTTGRRTAVTGVSVDGSNNLTTTGILGGSGVEVSGVSVLNAGLGTGVVDGGVLSVGTGAAQFSITDGSGIIVDNTTDPANPTVTEVSWTGLANITVTSIGTQILTFVSIDSGGSVIQQGTSWTRQQARDRLLLGVVVHVNLTSVDAVNNEQHAVINVPAQLNDIFRGLGFVNVNGNVFGPSGANLTIDKTVGVVMNHGVNWDVDPKNPNHKTLGALTNATFQYRFLDGSNGTTGSLIDPDIYDDGGTSTTVPNNKWTVQRIYSFVSNNVKVQPGQTLYNTFTDAEAHGLGHNSFVTEPSIAANGLLRGFLVVRKGATDLSGADAVFIEAGRFGGDGSASASSGVSDAATLIVEVVKGSAGTVAIGEVVYVSGFNAIEALTEVELADASAAGTMPAYGISRDTITNTASGSVVISGKLEGLDTSSWSVGDALYVSEVTGALTNVKPQGTALVQKIATVARSDGLVGALEVFGAGRANDLPNLPQNNLWIGDVNGVPQEVSAATSGDVAGTLPGPLTVTDLTITGEVQGSVLYFNGTNWVQLSPGAVGDLLTAAGPGANPSWVVPSADLQTAYDNGNTIVTASTTPILFTLTSGGLTVNGAGAVDIGSAGADVGGFAVGTSTFNIDATGNVTIDSSGGSLNFGADANTGAINVGTGAAARTITVGNTTGATQLDLSAGTGHTNTTTGMAWTGTISPTSLGSSQNNYTPTGIGIASVIRQDSSVDVSITGITGGTNGRILVITNIGVNTITLPSEDAGSTAANRFLFGASFVRVFPNDSVILQYDGTSSRWRAPATSKGTVAGDVKTLFTQFGSNSSTALGEHNTITVGSNGSLNLEARIPADFNAMISLAAIMVPGSTNAAANIDLTSTYAAVGELYDLNTETNTTITFNVTDATMTAIEASSVATGVTAGDFIGILFNHKSTGGSSNYIGMVLTYT